VEPPKLQALSAVGAAEVTVLQVQAQFLTCCQQFRFVSIRVIRGLLVCGLLAYVSDIREKNRSQK